MTDHTDSWCHGWGLGAGVSVPNRGEAVLTRPLGLAPVPCGPAWELKTVGGRGN